MVLLKKSHLDTLAVQVTRWPCNPIYANL